LPETCRVIAVLGTRPDAIKLALVIQDLRRRSAEFETAVVPTGQHRTMLDEALEHFKIKPDFTLDVMRPNQTLSMLTGRVVDTMENACDQFNPNIVLVQGDTTTAFGAALAAYYCKVSAGHVKARLRSRDIYNPFPEEANRRFASVATQIHFAPTALSRDSLMAEGIPATRIVVTGNTVVDALRGLSQLPHSWENTPLASIPADGSRLVLVTSRRRESWGSDQENISPACGTFHPDYGPAVFSILRGQLPTLTRQLYGRARNLPNRANLGRPHTVWTDLLHLQIRLRQENHAHRLDNGPSFHVSPAANPASGDRSPAGRTVRAGALHRIRIAVRHLHHPRLLRVGNELGVGSQRQKGIVAMSGGLVLRLSIGGIHPSGVQSERRESGE